MQCAVLIYFTFLFNAHFYAMYIFVQCTFKKYNLYLYAMHLLYNVHIYEKYVFMQCSIVYLFAMYVFNSYIM